MHLIKNGDLFQSGADVLVNTVNCVSIMGKGIALEFKKRFPLNFEAYRDECKHNRLQPGGLFVFPQHMMGDAPHGPDYIVNFATKDHWRNPSQMEWVVDGLNKLKNWLVRRDVDSIAIPALGCANGGLDWNDVKPLIEEHVSLVNERRPDIEFYIYEPR